MHWAPIPGFEGRYEASDTGLIRSLPRKIETQRGVRLIRGRVLKPGKLGNTNHRHVVLEGRVDRPVHCLILEAFVGLCPPGMEARHLDDDPTNNRLDNLAWGSRRENSADAIRNDRHFNAGLTHCKRGHKLTPENTQQHGKGTARSDARRTCLQCRRERQAIYNSGGRLIPEGFCPNGHSKTPENRISNGPRGTRCRLCAIESSRRRAGKA